MKKRTKVLIGILIVISIIAIVCLALFLKIMLIVSNSTVVGVEDNRIVRTAVEKVCEQEYKLDDVILKNLNLEEIDKSNVKVGDYIYLFIENDYTYYYCENTNYYSKVLEINDDNIKVAIPDWQFYSFNAEDANIKDDNGNKIDISDLKLGDDIQIISILPDSIPDIAEIFEGYPSKSIYNVKNVKIKETNESLKENFENRDMIAIKKAIIVGVNKNSLQEIRKIYKDNDFISRGVQGMYDGDFIKNPYLERGYIKVFEMGSSVYDSPLRSINYARIISFKQGDPDITFINIDLENVEESFMKGIDSPKVKLPEVVAMLREFNVASKYPDDNCGRTELENWVSGQKILLGTVFQRNLALFMLANPQWFSEYNGSPESYSGEINDIEDSVKQFDFESEFLDME